MMEMLLLVVWPTKHQTLIQYGLTDENSAFPDNEAWHNLPALKPRNNVHILQSITVRLL